jgi:DNA primase
MDNTKLISSVESVLGKGKKTSSGNVAYHCPFCNHHKRKLEIQMTTNNRGENQWNCWVCQKRGRKLINLYKQLNLAYDKIVELNLALGIASKDINNLFTEHKNYNSTYLSLPNEFKAFLDAENTPDYRNALKYLREDRGFTDFDIIKYHLGFCETGPYRHKIIIPSYNNSGSLNFFAGRDFYGSEFKHKNPNYSKNIVGFELYINWQLPVILVEGAIDAITIKRNAIPLFGKTIPDELRKRLIEKRANEIYICLDKDAQKQALTVAEEFMNEGMIVYFVNLEEKDPNEIGFARMVHIIKNTEPLSFSDLIKYKINL